jgi:glycosyltransferase involved in cell wall biosynthesis
VIQLFVNALAASAGSGLTYLYNVVPQFSAFPELRVTLALPANLRGHFREFPQVCVLDANVPAGTAQRFWFEQRGLPALIRQSGADVLLSAGNFALLTSPVPQILLSGNSLYSSRDFFRDLRRRRDYRIWLDTRVKGFFARKSLDWADCTVAPSEAYAAELRHMTRKRVAAIHHGFDRDLFFHDSSPLPSQTHNLLATANGHLRLLYVSHYNYYRNFETLFRAIARARQKQPDLKIRLILTCKLRDHANPGAYRTAAASRLVTQLGIQDEVVELGAVPYRSLHHVYRACDLYVSPAYTETFAHPLVEAMASGLPVLASDLPVHREVCGPFATYFPRFSHQALADRILDFAASPPPRPSSAAIDRFSWRNHAEQIFSLAVDLLGANPSERAWKFKTQMVSSPRA